MTKDRMEFQSLEKAGAHVIREEKTAVLHHSVSATSILFGSFMLDRPRPASPKPERPKRSARG